MLFQYEALAAAAFETKVAASTLPNHSGSKFALSTFVCQSPGAVSSDSRVGSLFSWSATSDRTAGAGMSARGVMLSAVVEIALSWSFCRKKAMNFSALAAFASLWGS